MQADAKIRASDYGEITLASFPALFLALVEGRYKDVSFLHYILKLSLIARVIRVALRVHEYRY
jgi:hypothetical protein